MDVFLFLNVVRFCNDMQVQVFNSRSLVHQSPFCVKVQRNFSIIADLPQDRCFAVILWQYAIDNL